MGGRTGSSIASPPTCEMRESSDRLRIRSKVAGAMVERSSEEADAFASVSRAESGPYGEVLKTVFSALRARRISARLSAALLVDPVDTLRAAAAAAAAEDDSTIG